jgi:phage-related protein
VAVGRDKPLAWLHGEIKTPPFSKEARIQVGVFLRRLQRGESLGLPHSRAMPSIGRGCHELRITDRGRDAIVICDVFAKKRRTTPREVVARCQRRLEAYDRAAGGRENR